MVSDSSAALASVEPEEDEEEDRGTGGVAFGGIVHAAANTVTQNGWTNWIPIVTPIRHSRPVASRREYAIAVVLTALTAFFMAGLPHLIKSNAATRGYDYAEKLALATEQAHARASDAQLLSARARYVDSDGRVLFPDFHWGHSQFIKWESSSLTFEFQSPSGGRAAPQTMLGAPVSGRATPCSIVRA